ncbi:hypothetical protein ABK040_012008 [Willaertia magna]
MNTLDPRKEIKETEILGSLDNYMSTLRKKHKIDESLSKLGERQPITNDKIIDTLKETKSTKKVNFSTRNNAGDRMFMQEKALRKYEYYSKVWDNLAETLAKKRGEDRSKLVMESVDAFRLKQEELDYLEASIPPEKKFNETSWEITLRNYGTDEGVRYIKLGEWPYPLFCPVSQTKKVLPVTIRNPNRISLASEETPLGIRKKTSSYVNEKYGEFLSNTLNHDPAPEIGGLQIIGNKISEYEDTLVKKEDFLEQSDVVTSISPFEEQQSTLSSFSTPYFNLSENDILFDAPPSKLIKKEIELQNIGSCALQYKWVRIKPLTQLQEKRAEFKFQLSSESKGIILPNRTKVFTFSFSSNEEGIYTDGYRLETIPRATCKSNEVNLKGVVINDKQSDISLFQAKEEKESIYLVMHDIVNSMIDSLTEPKPLPDNTEQIRETKMDRLRERFTDTNRGMFEGSLKSISTALLKAFQYLALNTIKLLSSEETITNKLWDYSLYSLRIMIQRVTNEEKRQFLLNLLLELLKVLEKEQTTELDYKNKGLEHKIRYSVMYDEILNTLDEIVETACFLEETVVIDQLRQTTSTKDQKKKNAESSEEKVDPTILEKELREKYRLKNNGISF